MREPEVEIVRRAVEQPIWMGPRWTYRGDEHSSLGAEMGIGNKAKVGNWGFIVTSGLRSSGCVEAKSRQLGKINESGVKQREC